MKKRLAQYQAQLAILENFVDRYGDKIPEDFGTLSPGDSYDPQPKLSVYLDSLDRTREHSQANRDKALLLAGQVFGRDEWVSTMNHDRNAFNWETTRHGVKITIHNAALITEPRVSFPVPMSAFPIALEDEAPIIFELWATDREAGKDRKIYTANETLVRDEMKRVSASGMDCWMIHPNGKKELPIK